MHFIAPARYVRASHEIVRHPRLRATAKTLLLWALSLPPGSRDTILTIGKRMPEGRTAVARARAQLIEEGYLHVRRSQHPTKGTWTTRVLVSSVPLTEPDEIEAAWRGSVRNPALGEGEGREAGTSPKGEKNERKTSSRVETDREAAGLLGRLTARDRRLRLGAAEVLDLAPLVADWLARDPDVGRLREALLEGLPSHVLAPAGFLRARLERRMPEAVAGPGAAAGRLRECASCADPVAGGGVVCRRCTGVASLEGAPDTAAVERNRRGVERARSLLRGAMVAAAA
ncbi:helix-turn-helix domain-containing protein [Streptomyces viridifaciens]|nr:helix-turn-helix domain-containing protein [Streptomyces viridifaciens]